MAAIAGAPPPKTTRGMPTQVTTVRHPDGTMIRVETQGAAPLPTPAPTPPALAGESVFFSFTPCAFKPAAASACSYSRSCKGFDASPERRQQGIALKPAGVSPDDPSATLWRPTPAGPKARWGGGCFESKVH